jgi:hypothetical protein
MNAQSNVRVPEPRRPPVRPPPAPVNDDKPASVSADDFGEYLELITASNDLVAKGPETHTNELGELRAEIDALRGELDRLRAENAELRVMKSEFGEVRARAAETASQAAEFGFKLTRIANDRRGEPGRDGEPGPMGPPGRDGLRGPKGEKGMKGDRIASWTYDVQDFRCTPVFSDGSLGVAIDFKPILEAAYASAMITDDTVVAEEMVEEHYIRDYEAKMARFGG